MGVSMKKPDAFFGLTVLLLVLAGTLLTGCEADEDNSALEETQGMQNLAYANEVTDHITLNGGITIEIPTENIGVTSANVRLYREDTDRARQEYYPYRLLNLSQFSNYHELILTEDAPRSIFTTETTVSDFRFLSVFMNQYFWRENADEGERRYIVQDTLYFLDELTPDVPFVVQGAILGGTFAAHGFSFLDEDGETRYFSIEQSGKTGLVGIFEF
jgi:hypothetical protein